MFRPLWHSPAEYTGRGRTRFGKEKTPRMPNSRSKRVLIYSHDSFGLGHVSRCRTIANALVGADPNVSVLIVSGSPVIGSYEFRSGIDFVRIPGVVKIETGEYEFGQSPGRPRAYAGDAHPDHPRHRRHLSARPVHRRQGADRPARRGRAGAQASEGARHAAGARPARRHGRPGGARRRMGAQARRAGAARSLRRDLDLRPAADQQAADRHRGAAVGAPQDGLYRLPAPRPALAQRRAARDGGDRRALHPGHRGRRRRRRRPDRLGAGAPTRAIRTSPTAR